MACEFRWPTSAASAIALQRRLAGRVRVQPMVGPARFVAGVDVAFSPRGDRCLAGVVVYDLVMRETVEQRLAWRAVRFPYIPGLLSFREAPAALAAVRRLACEPDVFLFDGQGIAHPRRLGLASHAGLILGHPTIGCAKSRLCGTYEEPPAGPGRSSPLIDHGDVIGAVLRTRPNVRPVFVSVGHLTTLEDAIAVVTACVTRYRLPEPIRQAHLLVTRHRLDSIGR